MNNLTALGFTKTAGPLWSALETAGKAIGGAFKSGQGLKDIVAAGTKPLVSFATPEGAAFKSGINATKNSFFGMGPAKQSLGSIPGKGPGVIAGSIGDTAKMMNHLVNGEGSLGNRVVGALKNQWDESKYFTKTIGGNTHRFERSAVGRIAAPIATTGLGIGAMDALTATNKDGTPAGPMKRIAKGVSSTALWGLSAPAYGAYTLGRLGFDAAKSVSQN